MVQETPCKETRKMKSHRRLIDEVGKQKYKRTDNSQIATSKIKSGLTKSTQRVVEGLPIVLTSEDTTAEWTFQQNKP